MFRFCGHGLTRVPRCLNFKWIQKRRFRLKKLIQSVQSAAKYWLNCAQRDAWKFKTNYALNFNPFNQLIVAKRYHTTIFSLCARFNHISLQQTADCTDWKVPGTFLRHFKNHHDPRWPTTLNDIRIRIKY